ncbi:MAG TPA: hypothetical protein VMG59_12170 [Phycisphaerae bacterium]|nr:hypothetical protein [Phycisphaerae bacterium]
MNLFSRKNQPKPDTYQYTFPSNVRSRILLTFAGFYENNYDGSSFRSLLDDVAPILAREYGGLMGGDQMASPSHDHHPVILHLSYCSDPQVIDFITIAFRSWNYRAGQHGVDEINRILREESIGYEFTQYVEREVLSQDSSGRTRRLIEYDYPEVIVKHEEYAHESIVKPCLSVLANPVFKVANDEMLKAHEHIRKNNLDDAITCCGAAYESVIKTVLDKKGWTYDAKKDTCATLVDICVREGLLPGFCADAFKAPGRFRNNLSSAHGRGPTPLHVADLEHVDYMIQLSSANIIFLVKLAKF